MTVANGLDPDQVAKKTLPPDLVPNCLSDPDSVPIAFLEKANFERKKSADDIKSMKNYQQAKVSAFKKI